MITNQRCSPAHRIIADCFSSFLSWIIHMLIPYFNNDDVYDSNIVINRIIKGIGYVVIFIGLMIFLEFILINKWGMNKNTTFNIDRRGAEESLALQNGSFKSSLYHSLKNSLCGSVSSSQGALSQEILPEEKNESIGSSKEEGY